MHAALVQKDRAHLLDVIAWQLVTLHVCHTEIAGHGTNGFNACCQATAYFGVKHEAGTIGSSELTVEDAIVVCMNACTPPSKKHTHRHTRHALDNTYFCCPRSEVRPPQVCCKGRRNLRAIKLEVADTAWASMRFCRERLNTWAKRGQLFVHSEPGDRHASAT